MSIHVVVIRSNGKSKGVGPFNSHQEAYDWATENDDPNSFWVLLPLAEQQLHKKGQARILRIELRAP